MDFHLHPFTWHGVLTVPFRLVGFETENVGTFWLRLRPELSQPCRGNREGLASISSLRLQKSRLSDSRRPPFFSSFSLNVFCQSFLLVLFIFSKKKLPRCEQLAEKKLPSCCCWRCRIGPDDTVFIPKVAREKPEVDFEAELAIVLGKALKNCSPAEALESVLGITGANDISARRWVQVAGAVESRKASWIKERGNYWDQPFLGTQIEEFVVYQCLSGVYHSWAFKCKLPFGVPYFTPGL